MAGEGVDVLVIGAGSAGLRCASVIAAAGHDVRVWERDDDVGRHAADIMGADSGSWNLLTRSTIRPALPAQPAPLRPRRPVAVGDGLWWCGDHRETASIQGALVSGRRTAEEILRARP